MSDSHRRGDVVAPAIAVTCRLFGRYAELVGLERIALDLPVAAAAADAVRVLRSSVARAGRLPERPLVAVNREHVALTHSLSDGDEVALLPPLAGG